MTQEPQNDWAAWVESIYFWTMRLFRGVINWFRYRTTRRYFLVNTGLEPNYYDVDTRMLHACFSLLVDFVEKEKPEESIDWQADESHSMAWNEISYLYLWWTSTRNLRKDPLDYSYSSIDGWMNDPLFKDACVQSSKLEAEWYEEDTINLMRLMKIRSFLWT